MSVTDRLRALDRRQQQSPRLGFIAAVVKKFGDDQAGQLAALIAYYGFVSLFPLLLVFVTVLGFVLQGNPERAGKRPALDAQPVPDHRRRSCRERPLAQRQRPRRSRSGWSARCSPASASPARAQNAFNQVWHVPHKHRPNFLTSRLRGLGLLVVLGVLAIVSTVAAGYVTAGGGRASRSSAGVLVALVVNLLLFFTAFRLLTATRSRRASCCPA